MTTHNAAMGSPDIPIIGSRVMIKPYLLEAGGDGLAMVQCPAGGIFVGLSFWKGDKVAWVLANTLSPKGTNGFFLYQCGHEIDIPPEVLKRLSPLGQFTIPKAGQPEWPLEVWFVFHIKSDAAVPKPIPRPGEGRAPIPILKPPTVN